MAKINMKELVKELNHDFKDTLEATLKEVAPETKVDRYKLYETFKEQVESKFSKWSDVSDSCLTE